jgi:cytochrome c oxidase subunit 3/cytochrome o ubiquinol oxidase subunit 3
LAHPSVPVPEHEYTSTGLNSRKMLMWVFLGSECLFFGSLISTYTIYRNHSVASVKPETLPPAIFDIPYTSVSSFVLLMSSLTMVLALAALQRGKIQESRVWLAATGLLGSIFVGGQVYEFTGFIERGATLQSSLFGTTFFTLTGFHGAHVTVGIIILFSVFLNSLRGKIRQENSLVVELAGLYWHFVDIVWVVIFTVVYLLPY